MTGHFQSTLFCDLHFGHSWPRSFSVQSLERKTESEGFPQTPVFFHMERGLSVSISIFHWMEAKYFLTISIVQKVVDVGN